MKYSKIVTLVGAMVVATSVSSFSSAAINKNNNNALKEYLSQKVAEQIWQNNLTKHAHEADDVKVSVNLPAKAGQVNPNDIDAVTLNNAANHTFQASFRTEDEQEFKFNGRYEEMAAVPVAARHLSRGETVNEEDVGEGHVSSTQIKADTLTDHNHIIGKTLKQNIKADGTFNKNALKNQELVQKNKPVTLIYDSRGVEIKASGTALENGAKGDLIKVRNTRSNQTVHGTVEDHGVVAIQE